LEAQSIILTGYTNSKDNKNKRVDITKGVSVLSYDMEKIYAYCYTDNNKYYEELKKCEKSIVIEKEKKEKSDVVKIKRALSKFCLPKNFNGKLDYSLFLKKFYKLHPEEFACDFYGKQYTDAIINVTCKRPYKIAKISKKGIISCKVKLKPKGNNKVIMNTQTIMDKLALRKHLYSNGFKFNQNEYCFFTRSSSKARNGASLFIKKEYLLEMLNWLRISIQFIKGEECVISNLKAYESLVFSAIEPKLLTIKPNQILIVDDIKMVIEPRKMLASRLVNTNGVECVETKLETISEINNYTDGESMLDESIFNEVGKGKKGCLLTRARFFKSCAFNTKLVAFLKYIYKDKYDTAIIKDYFKNDIKVADIRLVITLSSLKLLKFSYKISNRDMIISKIGDKLENEDDKQYEKRISYEMEKECYKYWLDSLEETDYEFGICKSEKSSSFGEWQQLSYQMLQALRLNKKELRELIKAHITFINNLKKDDVIFNWYLHTECVGVGKDLLDNLLAVKDEVYKTELYRKKKSNITNALVDRLRNGQVLVKNCDYSIAFGNCIEFLYHAVGIKKQTMRGYECYSPRYDIGEELFCTRNPVVCSANIGLLKNKYHDDYKWFNLTPNIFVLNSYDCNTLTKYSGEDYDSDCNILGNNPILVNEARNVKNDILPYNGIEQTEEDKKKKKYYTDECMSETDYTISENLIGVVINASQVLNALYMDYAAKGKNSNSLSNIHLSEIYSDIILLNNLSNIEIDKAKKQLSVNSAYELAKIMKKPYIRRKLGNTDKKILSKREYDYFTQLTMADSIDEIIQELEDDQLKKAYKHRQQFIDGLVADKKEGLNLNDIIKKFLSREMKKIIRPIFFKHTTNKSDAYIYEPMKCTMDFLQELIDDQIVTGSRVRKYTPIYKLFDIQDESFKNADRKKVGKVKYFCTKADKLIDSVRYLTNEEKNDYLNRQEYIELTGNLLKTHVKSLSLLDLKALIVKGFTEKPEGEKEKDKYWKMYDEELFGMRLTLMDILYAAYPSLMMECFGEIRNISMETLVEDENGDIVLLDKKYKKVKKKIKYVA
jgi:hypothetical protein